MRLLRFPSAARRDGAVDAWFERMRTCGDDVRELLHDGHLTACVGDAAFGYANAFTAHVNATCQDPARHGDRRRSAR